MLCNDGHMIIYFGICFLVDEYNYTLEMVLINTHPHTQDASEQITKKSARGVRDSVRSV